MSLEFHDMGILVCLFSRLSDLTESNGVRSARGEIYRLGIQQA